MRRRKISGYLAILFITIIGSLAAYAMVYLGTTVEAEAGYAYIDPFNINVDFGY